MNPLTIDKNLAKYFFILYKLAEIGARGRVVKASTKFLAEKMGFSQQSISRYLIELERLGWIQRTSTHDGGLLRISDSGETQLKKVQSGLSIIFGEKYPSSVTIEGIVFTGLGEGAYYVTREQYRKQFIEKLGFDPYPGTLNLKVTSEYDAKLLDGLKNYSGTNIEGFKNEDRTYGSVKCFPALINNKEKGTVVCALRSHYNHSVIEIISPINLRDRLKLKDGKKVKVEMFVTEA